MDWRNDRRSDYFRRRERSIDGRNERRRADFQRCRKAGQTTKLQ